MSSETYFVEYSPTQKQFHVEPVLSAIAKNRAAIASGAKVDYVPIGIACDEGAVQEIIRRFKRVTVSAWEC